MKYAIVLVLAARVAHADCDPQTAIATLPATVNTVTYCEACGDKAPGLPASLAKGELVARDPVVTYVQIAPRRYANLAALEGCLAHAATPSLRVELSTNGADLIYADATPVDAIAAPPPPPPATLPAPASTVYVYTHNTETIGWLPIVLACSGTSMLWALGTFALVRRRRRALTPRAVELVDRQK